jgi:hypothetical protein
MSCIEAAGQQHDREDRKAAGISCRTICAAERMPPSSDHLLFKRPPRHQDADDDERRDRRHVEDPAFRSATMGALVTAAPACRRSRS